MKKKILAVVISVALLLSLAACAANESDETTSADTSVTTSEDTSATESEDTSEATTEVHETIDVSGVTLMQAGTLTIGVEIGYPPLEDFAEDGSTPVGYDIDFAKALGEKLGLEINFINTAWDGIFQGIDVNYDCVISAVTITDERKETMSVLRSVHQQLSGCRCQV